jgi:hypothetical protein
VQSLQIDIMNSRRHQRLYGYLRIIPSTANQVLNAESSVTQVQQLVLMSGADYIRSLTFHFISSPTWTELEHKYHKQISKVLTSIFGKPLDKFQFQLHYNAALDRHMKYCKQTRQTPPRLAKKSVADFDAKADSRANSQITLNAAALTPSRLLDDPSYTGNNMDITHPAVEEHDQAKQSSSQPLPSNPLTAYYADTTSSSSSQPLSKKRKTNTGEADVAGKRTIHETKLLLIIMRHERDAQLSYCM